MEFQPIRYRMPLTWALKTLPEGARLPAYGTPGFAVRATIPEEILGSRLFVFALGKSKGTSRSLSPGILNTNES